MVKIVDQSRPRRGLRFDKRVQLLLSFVPKEDLIGLGQIVLLDEPIDKWRKERLKNARAAYYQAYGGLPAYIQLYADRIFGAVLPLMFFIPLAATRMMAWTLFHEIGHHRNKALHGITKGKEEHSAEAYAERLYEEFERYYYAFHRRAVRWGLNRAYYFLLSLKEPAKSNFRTCKAALKEKPDEPSALINLAHLHYHFLRFRKSRRLYQKALQLRPDNGDVYYELGCIEWWQRNWRECARLFELAIKYKTKNKDASRWLEKARSRASRSVV